MTPTLLYTLFSLLALVGLFIGLDALRRRQVPGASEVAAIGVLHAITVVFQLFEFLADDRAGKLFWDDLQWIPLVPFLAGYFRLALRYGNYSRRALRAATVVLGVLWIISLPIVATAGEHTLVRFGERLQPFGPIEGVTYEFGLFAYALSALSLLCLFLSIVMLVVRWHEYDPSQRPGVAILLIAIGVPILGGIASLLGLTIGPFRDFLPFTYTLSLMLLGFLLLRSSQGGRATAQNGLPEITDDSLR